MFKKIECRRCKRKINEKYDFCPHCGNEINNGNEEDWGMLGRNDDLALDKLRFPMGLNSLLSSLMKSLDKQFKELNKEAEKGYDKPVKKTGISISISSSMDGKPKIRVNSFGNDLNKKNKEEIKKFISKNFSDEKIRKFLNSPREEPKTNIRRFSNKVIYEIDMPEVKTIEDISIIQLENSIEIRGISQTKSYFKSIPINLSIIRYNLAKGKLILELKA